MAFPTRAGVLVAALGITSACQAPVPDQPDPVDTYELELVSQLGAADGESALAGIRWVGPAAHGGVLVLETITFETHVYGRDGRRRLTFGGKGEGPGQVRSAHYAGWSQGDSYGVGETYPPRLHVFGGDGNYLTSLDPWTAGARLPDGSAGTFGLWRAAGPDTAYLQVNPIPLPGGGGNDAYLLRFVRRVDGEWSIARLREWTNALDVGPAGPPLLAPMAAWAAAPGGEIYFTPGGEYEIEKRAADGSPIHTIRRAVEAQAVTEDIRAAVLDIVRSDLAETLPAGDVDAMLEAAEFAATIPAIDRLLYDSVSDRLWVGRPDAASIAERRPPSAWDLFDSGGMPVGSVALPEHYRLMEVRDDRLYGVWKDDLDVEYARVYRLTRVPPRR